MGLLEGLLSARGETRPSPLDDRYYGGLPTTSSSGYPVNAETAIKVAAVYAAVKILSETLAMLPFIVQEDDGEKRRRAINHPLYPILHDIPNDYQTSFEFREMMQGFVALRGNAYAEIISGRRFVEELRPIHPDSVTRVERLPDRSLRYTIRQPDGQSRVLAGEQVLHIKNRSEDGLIGISVLGVARNSIGLAASAEDYAARLYANDARPGGYIKHPGKLSLPAAKVLRDSWADRHQGSQNAYKPAVLEEGMEWHQMSMNADDTQFLETRQFSVSEIARWFRIPPHMLADLSRATFSNIAEQGTEFVTYTMLPWVGRWEQSVNRALIANPERFSSKIIVDALLRGTTKDRYLTHNIALNGGWKTRNEVREIEGLNPLPGLDEIVTPLNMGKPGGNPEAPPPMPRGESGETEFEALSDESYSGGRFEFLAKIVAGSLAHKEVTAITRIGRRVAAQASDDDDVFAAEITAFYQGFATEIVAKLGIDSDEAFMFASAARDEILAGGLIVADNWISTHTEALYALAIGVPLSDPDPDPEPGPDPEPEPLPAAMLPYTKTIESSLVKGDGGEIIGSSTVETVTYAER